MRQESPDPSQKMQNPIQGGGRRGTRQREICWCDRGVCVSSHLRASTIIVVTGHPLRRTDHDTIATKLALPLAVVGVEDNRVSSLLP